MPGIIAFSQDTIFFLGFIIPPCDACGACDLVNAAGEANETEKEEVNAQQPV